MSDKEDSKPLKVLPLVDEKPHKNALKKKLNPILPDIAKGCLLGIVSSVCSGKTVLINNLFLNSDFFKDCFDTSFFISPTIYNDKSMRFVRETYPATCYDEYSDNLVHKICAFQEKQPFDDRGSYSVVADDCIDLKRGSALTHLASRFRHYSPKASLVIFSTQRFRSLGNTIRVNATHWLIGGTVTNKKEREAIIEEFADNFGGPENFEQMWKQCNEKYCFLYLKMDRVPAEAYKMFDTKLYPNGNEKSEVQPPVETEIEEDGLIENETLKEKLNRKKNVYS